MNSKEACANLGELSGGLALLEIGNVQFNAVQGRICMKSGRETDHPAAVRAAHGRDGFSRSDIIADAASTVCSSSPCGAGGPQPAESDASLLLAMEDG